MPFASLARVVKKPDVLVFFDIEGTQFTHKAIAIAFVARKWNADQFCFSPEAPLEYHSYISCEDEIGSRVKELTGITPELLKEKGKPFSLVIREISTLLRPYQRLFVSYGANDMMMLSHTIDSHRAEEKNFFQNVTRHYLDFHHYLGNRIVTKKGQSFSLEKMMDCYSLPQKGNFHDPLVDARCLADIFEAYLRNEDRDVELVLENYVHNRNMDGINAQLAKKIVSEGKAEKEDLLSCIRENL